MSTGNSISGDSQSRAPFRKIQYSFVPNHRDIMEALARSRLSAREFRVVLLILNQTNGYLRQEDTIRPAFFEQRTGISRKHLWDVISRLRSWNIIGQNGRKFKVNLPNEWVPDAFYPKFGEKRSSPKTGKGTPKTGKKLPKNGGNQLCSKEEPKEELSKENPLALNAPFEETLNHLLATKKPQVAVYEILKAKWPDYSWDRKQIGLIGQTIERWTLQKVLAAIWVAETQRPIGNPLSYVKAILLNKGRLPQRAEATRGPEDFKGEW